MQGSAAARGRAASARLRLAAHAPGSACATRGMPGPLEGSRQGVWAQQALCALEHHALRVHWRGPWSP